MSRKSDIGVLNHLLKKEQGACESYENLLKDTAQHPDVWDLFQIQTDHHQTVGHIKHQIESLGGEPTPDRALPIPDIRRKAVRLSEDHATLEALRQIEGSEAADCREALRTPDLAASARTLIESHVLPILERHVETLDRYLGQARGA